METINNSVLFNTLNGQQTNIELPLASTRVNDSVNNDKVINKDLSNLSQSIVMHKSFNDENVVQRNLNTDRNIELLSQSIDDIEILI